jgi:hypothetical protein
VLSCFRASVPSIFFVLAPKECTASAIRDSRMPAP